LKISKEKIIFGFAALIKGMGSMKMVYGVQ
jgi:hypothetical protein